MRDFLLFKKMITPVLVQLLFWVAVIGFVVAAGYRLHAHLYLEALSVLVLGPLAARIAAELILVVFNIHDNLHKL